MPQIKNQHSKSERRAIEAAKQKEERDAEAAASGTQKAPKQETPLSDNMAPGYGTEAPPHAWHHHLKFPTPDEIDARMPKKMATICNDWIVGTHQFDEMENAGGALVCARVLRGFLIFFIITSSIGLCVGFFFKASLASPMETEQYGEMDAPSVVFCASPWGTDFLGFDVISVQEGEVPGKAFASLPGNNWSVQSFNASLGHETASMLTGCKVIALNDVRLHPHGKVAQYTAFDTIRMAINAQTEDGMFNFGFANADGELPQRWAYGSLGERLSGEISYDQVNVGASDVSEGTPRSILGFKGQGSTNLGTRTEVEYYFGYFMVRVLSAQAKGLTIFACVAFVLLFAAAVNNCGLFELFFVEYIPDDEEPPALVPNLVCQAICGNFFTSCRRRKPDPADEEDPKEAEAA